MSWLNVLIRTLLCLTFVFLPLHSLDEWFYDKAFKLRGVLRHPTEFALVRVSEEKLLQILNTNGIAYSKDSPATWLTPHSIWYRSFYERLLENILGDHPKAIVFTSFFESMNPSKIIPTLFPSKNQPVPIFFASSLDHESKLITPPKGLGNSTLIGFNNIFPDQDNIVRQSRLVYSSELSLAVRLFRILKDKSITMDLTKPIWIDYRGPTGSYPNWEGSNIYETKNSDGRFKDKIVLIGNEGSPASDLGTPLGFMSRLEIHANTIDTFLNQRNIRKLPSWNNVLTSVLAVGVSIFLILYFPMKLAWVLLLGFAGFTALVQLLLFSEFKLWIGLANPITAILGTHLVMIGYKLARQEEEQWRLEKEAGYLREVDQFKNNFISLFSHDLKTPIAKIKAIADRLLQEKRDGKLEGIERGLLDIDRTNAELARLISDILKVTKMETMKLEPKREVVDINRVVEASIQRMKFLAEEKNISIISDLEPLFSIEGDAQLLQEVVTNLLENAIKYSYPERRVVIQTRETEEKIRVSVMDEGPGIPTDELPRVTSKFFRGRQATQGTKGSGLGLYLSKYFVELHGGTLTVASEPGKGATISFDIPL